MPTFSFRHIWKRSRQWFIELSEDTHRFEENYVFSWCRSRIAEVLRQTQSTSRILKRHFHWLQFVMFWECVCIRDFHSSNQIQRKHSLTKKKTAIVGFQTIEREHWQIAKQKKITHNVFSFTRFTPICPQNLIPCDLPAAMPSGVA